MSSRTADRPARVAIDDLTLLERDYLASRRRPGAGGAEPHVRLRARVAHGSARRRAAARPRVPVLSWATCACFSGLLAFGISSLAGNVLLEGARRDAIQRRDLARRFAREETDVKARVEALRNVAAIDAWAHGRGFRAADSVPAPSVPTSRGLLARRTVEADVTLVAYHR